MRPQCSRRLMYSGGGSQRCHLDEGHDGSHDWSGFQPGRGASILTEADQIIHGDRNESYGSYERECDRIAIGWTALLRDFLKDGVSIEPRFVPLMMVWLKASRDAHKPKRDNRRDGAGYWGLLEESYPAGDEQ